MEKPARTKSIEYVMWHYKHCQCLPRPHRPTTFSNNRPAFRSENFTVPSMDFMLSTSNTSLGGKAPHQKPLSRGHKQMCRRIREPQPYTRCAWYQCLCRYIGTSVHKVHHSRLAIKSMGVRSIWLDAVEPVPNRIYI